MAHKVAVVIPVYKDELNEFEKISLAQVQKVLGNYQIIFVAPEDKNFSYFTKGSKIYFFPPQFFQNVKTYSELMKSPIFYEIFLDYEYILIYQLDAFVFSDELEYFCGLGYDYIGAPWILELGGVYILKEISYRPRVGNGGFSLRKVKSLHNILTNIEVNAEKIRTMNEDLLFSLCGKFFPNEFKVAPLKIAIQFSAEYLAERFVKKNGGKLPFGCHAWYKLSKSFYEKIIPKFGYDLKNLSSKMISIDIHDTKILLAEYAIKRLKNRLEREQSVLRYLPNQNYSSIYVANDSFALKILEQLILEKNNLCDEIILYNEDDKNFLIQDLKSADKPCLIITADGNFEELLSGNRVVFFNKEYLNYCEKLFHNLGK